MTVQLILAEFGTDRLEPTVSSVERVMPSVKLKVYNEINTPKQPYAPGSERWGNRCNDYFKIKGLLDSEAQIAIAMDADMKVVHYDFNSIVDLAERFGLCLPANPRNIVAVDGTIGADSGYEVGEDKSLGLGYAYNMAPIAFDTKNIQARTVLARYIEKMETQPCRGPLAMWRAVWESSFNPYTLPLNWCVCKESVGIKNPICVHVGHPEVEKFYASS